MCGTETWHHPDVYIEKIKLALRTTNTLKQPAALVLMVVWLSPLPLSKHYSFEPLAFTCKPPLPMTILLIYRPPKPNYAFVPELQDLLTTLCHNHTTSANVVILRVTNIHVGNSSCHFASDFLELLDCINLIQHVDAPTHNKGHILDLVITHSVPISNLQVYDIGVSDQTIAM